MKGQPEFLNCGYHNCSQFPALTTLRRLNLSMGHASGRPWFALMPVSLELQCQRTWRSTHTWCAWRRRTPGPRPLPSDCLHLFQRIKDLRPRVPALAHTAPSIRNRTCACADTGQQVSRSRTHLTKSLYGCLLQRREALAALKTSRSRTESKVHTLPGSVGKRRNAGVARSCEQSTARIPVTAQVGSCLSPETLPHSMEPGGPYARCP